MIVDDRFTRFTISLSRLNKHIQKLKTDGMGKWGLKAVDTLCIYQLARCGEMSFSQVAERCDSDAALISRTLRELVKNGMVEKTGAPGKYNATYRLTPMGRERSEYIRRVTAVVQRQADQGVSPEDLETFYRVLDQLTLNFEKMTKQNQDLTAEGQAENKQED